MQQAISTRQLEILIEAVAPFMIFWSSYDILFIIEVKILMLMK